MAVIQITIPDEHVSRVLNAFAQVYSYDEYLGDGGTMTKAEFAKFRVIQYIKDVVKGVETQAAMRAAQGTVEEVPNLT